MKGNNYLPFCLVSIIEKPDLQSHSKMYKTENSKNGFITIFFKITTGSKTAENMKGVPENKQKKAPTQENNKSFRNNNNPHASARIKHSLVQCRLFDLRYFRCRKLYRTFVVQMLRKKHHQIRLLAIPTKSSKLLNNSKNRDSF